MKLWAGAIAGAIGVALAIGLLHEGSARPDLWDRLTNLGMGIFMVVVGLAVAGPEDLILDFPSCTYRRRSGLLFLAQWKEGSFSELSHLELHKHRGSTRWSVRLIWQGRRRTHFDLATFDDTGREQTDPRLYAERVMAAYADRLGLTCQDQNNEPLTPVQSAVTAPGVVVPAGVVAPVAAPRPPRVVPRNSQVGLKTTYYRLFTSDSTLHLEKARWAILGDDWQMVFWASMAGPVLGYILWWKGAYPQMVREAFLALGKVIPLVMRPGANMAERREEWLVLIVTAFVTPFALLALYAWRKLIHAVWRVARGETYTFDWPNSRLAFNGHEVSPLAGLRNVEVREHTQPRSGDSDGYITTYNLSLIFEDARRVTLLTGNQGEMSKLAEGVASFLGAEAEVT